MKIYQAPTLAPLIPARSGAVSLFLRGLKLGQVLQAEFLHRVGEGRALVRVGGQALVATHPGSLDTQGIFRVEVASLWPEVVLKIITADGGVDGSLQRILWKALPHMETEALERIWMSLAEEWRSLQMTGMIGKAGGLAFLLRYCLGPGSWNLLPYLLQSGLLLESKLAGRVRGYSPRRGPGPDLKAFILQILHAHGGKGEDLQASRSLLDLIQGSQALNLLNKDGETHLYLPLALWGFQEGDWGDLWIRGEGGGKDARRRSWTVTVRLDLRKMGRLLICMTLKREVLHCSLRASEPETRRTIRRGLPTLRERLSELGLRGVHCVCGALESVQEWDQTAKIIPEGLVETRA